MTNLVTNTILQQMGGRLFVHMTGAKNLVSLSREHSGADGLGMRIPKSKQGINAVRITLDEGADLYDVEFLRVYGTKITTKATHKGVYCDQLQSLFEDETGLLTRMGGH